MQRRSFLAATGSAVVTTLAGCSGLLGDGGDGEGTDGVGATTRWAVPASTPAESLAGYELRSVLPAGILEAHGAISPESVGDRLEDRSLAQRHLDVRELERFVEVEPVGHSSLNVYVVFEGPFDSTDVIESLGEEETVEVERVGAHGEYEIYDSGPGFAVHAIGEGTIVETDRLRNGEARPADVEAIVDAASGETDRITDQHEGLAATADWLEPSHHLGLAIEDPEQPTDIDRSQFAGAVASGMDAEVRGAQIELRTVVTFESEAARTAAPIDRWIEEARGQFASEELSTTVDGRFLEVTLPLPTSRLYG